MINRYTTTIVTTNATPTVAFSTPVPEGTSARVDVDFQVINAAGTQAASGTVTALFIRASGGNVTRATGNGGLLAAAVADNLGTFLYQTLNTDNGLGLTIADGSLEAEFSNPI